jgi:hypothetical protein
LGSNLIARGLHNQGKLSLNLSDNLGSWQQEVADEHSLLDNRAKLQITRTLSSITEPLRIDDDVPTGDFSAKVNLHQLTGSLLHVVTETVYYFDKLHLTEKIFKPIVAKRPFILVGAPGNLAYLKSYGFRTFDKWIDESYDSEPDHYMRIELITREIEKLCSLTPQQLSELHADMMDTLEYNYNHFYTTFKHHIVNELVDNYVDVIHQVNNSKDAGHWQIPIDPEYYDQVKQRLSS